MHFEFRDPRTEALFSLSNRLDMIAGDQYLRAGMIHMIWNRSNRIIGLDIDGVRHRLKPDQISTTTFLHRVKVNHGATYVGLTLFSFNKPFYCTKDHDHEVSCNGILFHGAQQVPVVSLDELERKKLELLLEVFLDEFETRDHIQGEMLQMLLKRMIIKVTRLARQQLHIESLPNEQIDLIRKYYVLVDEHFREHKTVKDYAELLFKSPKTIANVFGKVGDKTPLQIIHERIVLEAKRKLMFSTESIKEIAFDLGYTDTSAFVKLFKKTAGQTPASFRKEAILSI